MTNYILEKFSLNEQMQQSLCAAIILDLQASIQEKGIASLVVSGGNTPKRLFQLLSQEPLAWQNVTISLADDRWVDANHDASNEKLVLENLIQNEAKLARFVGLKNDENTAKLGEETCHRRLLELPKPIDVLVLGMGNDGHTASLFPCADELMAAVDESDLYCKAVQPRTAPYERMTLTLKTLLASKSIYLQIAGKEKYQVLNQASDLGPLEKMPIRYFLSGDNPLKVFWSDD